MVSGDDTKVEDKTKNLNQLHGDHVVGQAVGVALCCC